MLRHSCTQNGLNNNNNNCRRSDFIPHICMVSAPCPVRHENSGIKSKDNKCSGSCLNVRIICLRCDGKSKGASWLYMYCAYVRNSFIVKSWWVQLWSDTKVLIPRILKRIVPDGGKENGKAWFARMQAKTNVVSRGQLTLLFLAFATFWNTGGTGCALGS